MTNIMGLPEKKPNNSSVSELVLDYFLSQMSIEFKFKFKFRGSITIVLMRVVCVNNIKKI